jgi:transketolase
MRGDEIMFAYDFDDKRVLRDEIGEYLPYLGTKNDKMVVINADLGKTCRTNKFREKFPNRTFNVGIAEQDLIGFAAGLAHEGLLPFVFSMANFISMRACEQCRTDVAYGNLKVRLIAIYSGLSSGMSGATHWGMEDCAIMGSMANMTVVEPSDPVQARKMLDALLNYNGPVYMRNTVYPVAHIYDESIYSFNIGRASIAHEGQDGAFICSGVTTQFAVKAALQIERKLGKKIRVVDMHTLKPIDKNAVIEAAKTGRIVVAHDHNVVGGLGYYVAEILAESKMSPSFINLGIPDTFPSLASAENLYHAFGYDAEGLEKAMIRLL